MPTDLTPEMLDELERLREKAELQVDELVVEPNGTIEDMSGPLFVANKNVRTAQAVALARTFVRTYEALPALLAAARKKEVYEKALRQIADNSYCGMREDVCDCGAHAHDIAREALSGEGGTT